MKNFLLSIFLISSFLHGADFGTVVKIAGEAFFTISDKKTIITKGMSLPVGSTIETKAKSRVVIKLEQGTVVLNQNSTLVLDKSDFVKQKNGNIFFKITPLLENVSKDRFTIQTKTATIGIRGTDFIVTADDKSEKILLRHGKLNISSIEKEFQLYVKKEMDEFEAYKKALNKEFKEFVDTQNYEFGEYKKEFALEQNKFVYMKDGKVYQDNFTPEVVEMFDEFDQFME